MSLLVAYAIVASVLSSCLRGGGAAVVTGRAFSALVSFDDRQIFGELGMFAKASVRADGTPQNNWHSVAAAHRTGGGWAYRAELRTFAKDQRDTEKTGYFPRRIPMRKSARPCEKSPWVSPDDIRPWEGPVGKR
jgi:hypothetical protein